MLPLHVFTNKVLKTKEERHYIHGGGGVGGQQLLVRGAARTPF